MVNNKYYVSDSILTTEFSLAMDDPPVYIAMMIYIDSVWAGLEVFQDIS